MSKESVTIINNRDGEWIILKSTIGPDVIDISALYGNMGMFTLDRGFTSTASCRSRITYIDGDIGKLMYRGYDIEYLATKIIFRYRFSSYTKNFPIKMSTKTF